VRADLNQEPIAIKESTKKKREEGGKEKICGAWEIAYQAGPKCRECCSPSEARVEAATSDLTQRVGRETVYRACGRMKGDSDQSFWGGSDIRKAGGGGIGEQIPDPI